MATAKNIVNLTLSQAEAQTLRMILVRIGGDPKLSRRKHVDAMLVALTTSDVFEVSGNVSERHNSIYFEKEEGI